MPMPSRALLIVNTQSRSGREQCDAAIGHLLARGIDPVQVECTSREELSPLIVANAAGVDCAVERTPAGRRVPATDGSGVGTGRTGG